jgi:hypothetical protein
MDTVPSRTFVSRHPATAGLALGFLCLQAWTPAAHADAAPSSAPVGEESGPSPVVSSAGPPAPAAEEGGAEATPDSHANEVSPTGEHPEADTLFAEGRVLILNGDYDTACEKFLHAQQLRSGVGTLLHLADCEERRGRTYTAHRWYSQAAREAEAASDKRADLARTRLKNLESRMSSITFVGLAPGSHVRVDGNGLSPTDWAEPLLMDPGLHKVEIAAPGAEPWTSDVVVWGPREIEAPRVEQQLDASGDGWWGGTWRKKGAWISWGAGALSGVTWAALSFLAVDARDQARERCPAASCPTVEGSELWDTAVGYSTGATIAGSLALALAATGTTLWLLEPEDVSSQASVRVRFSPQLGGVQAVTGLGETWGGRLQLEGGF